MPENNFIYNNNYLLSNLDAQKLYAQSPLTTGVSGSSAYIGIEPSARYNETLLFENAAGSTAVAVSEPLSSFDYLLISGTNNQHFYTMGYYVPNNGFRFGCVQWTNTADANPLQIFGAYFTSNDGINYTPQGGHQIYFTKTGATIGGGNTKTNFPIYKIIGVNRK